MATAFSYSGTGLESAIQSGSGGITSTDTSVEVDSIPSDLSAGDTVKVALGTATQWSNGNGETVYGDIGTIGGGANGGTNITLTDRGQEGTSAASWGEGGAVRVGIQGRDDVGPERSFVQSALHLPRRVGAYADFNVPDQTISASFEIASGDTLTLQQGSASISDGGLKMDASSSPCLLTFPRPTKSYYIVAQFVRMKIGGSLGAGDGMIIHEYQGTNNYLYSGYFGLGVEFAEVVNGTSTQLNSASAGTDAEFLSLPLVSCVGDKIVTVEQHGIDAQLYESTDDNLSNWPLDSTNSIGFGCVSGLAYLSSFRIYERTTNE